MRKRLLIIGTVFLVITVGLSGCINKWEGMNVTTNPFLWIIEGDNPSYLYGSVHIADERILTLPYNVMDAIDDSDAILTEVSYSHLSDQEIIQMCSLPDGQTLKDVLPQETHNRLYSYLESKDIPTTSAFDTAKIWFIYLLLPILDDYVNSIKQRSSKQYLPSLDRYIENLAISKRKAIGALETVEEQATMLDDISLSKQIDLLNITLDYLDEVELYEQSSGNTVNELEFTIQVYLEGNLTLQEIFNSDLDSELRNILITERNHKMADRITQLISDNPNSQYFFTIGVGHYYGEEGLIELLEGKGFTITRVLPEVCDECESPKVKISNRCYYPYEEV